MEPRHEKMLQELRSLVDESGVENFLDPYPFRRRAEHMYRSYCWAGRILPCRKDADRELTLVSTLLHDIGILLATPERGKEEHDVLGAPLAHDFVRKHGYDADFADRAADLIARHQERELLQTGDTSIEHIILMEADMLDERGALGIVWDSMAEGAGPAQSYEQTLERFKKRKLYRRPERNPLFTENGRAFWAEKQRLHMQFVLALERDLGLTDIPEIRGNEL